MAFPAAFTVAADWRTQLQPDSRERIREIIMDNLTRRIPFSGEEGLQQLKKMAVSFEEKIYISAPSQLEYLRNISMKMLIMERKYPMTPTVNPLQTNATVIGEPTLNNQGRLNGEAPRRRDGPKRKRNTRTPLPEVFLQCFNEIPNRVSKFQEQSEADRKKISELSQKLKEAQIARDKACQECLLLKAEVDMVNRRNAAELKAKEDRIAALEEENSRLKKRT
ncbi:OLC1v1018934C1 [Oldenlandia corymbosa var. corymbosa]|uniref:OLC1v1018934C1 n=1 Tax=Oldenlandia corymbosa var. corymbosa TaxID=529605 RepID=A0AAV1ECW4_OLDCO|nr:OLC1v1018934C1 [Oldenlandia corymbosa var. corymbosa]